MQGLSTLGWIHTAASLIALACGALAFARHRRIAPQDGAGRLYLLFTLLAALTSLFVFSTGRVGPGHVVAVLTLGALLVVRLAAGGRWFGSASTFVQAAAVSATLLFHAVPGVTETLTRLPPGQPIFQREAPQLKLIYLVLLAMFLAALAVLWRDSRRNR